MKTRVLDVIGELELKQPAEIRAALEANDRLKYYFSLFLMAASHADNREKEIFSLRTDRLACGVDNPDFDEIPGGSERQNGRYRIPRCAKLLEWVTQVLRVMTTPAVTKGDFASHAAVIAQHLGKVYLVGCPSLDIDGHRRLCRIGEHLFHEGEFISFDGNDRGVYSGKLETVADRPERELARIEQWRAKCERAVGASRFSATRFSANG